jgi:glycosyltransferase involved in cell wall biosynthesis
MKVGIISSIYEPDVGGPATYLRQFRADLLSLGHSVRIVTYGNVPSETGIVRVARHLPLPIRLAAFGTAVARYLKDADVWYVNDYGVTAALLKAPYQKRAVMKIVGDWAWEYAVRSRHIQVGASEVGAKSDTIKSLEEERQAPLVEVRKAVRTFCARSMDEIIVPSAFLANVVARWGIPRSQIHIIYNGVRDDVGQPRDFSGPPTVLATGRLIRSKGFDVLLRAFATVLEEIPDAQVALLGDGPERRNLETLVLTLGLPRGSVRFAGQVSLNVVRMELAKARVFALPSAHEGLPHSVLEAMVAECPVVATPVGGIPEIVRHNVDGLSHANWAAKPDVGRLRNFRGAGLETQRSRCFYKRQPGRGVASVGELAQDERSAASAGPFRRANPLQASALASVN